MKRRPNLPQSAAVLVLAACCVSAAAAEQTPAGQPKPAIVLGAPFAEALKPALKKAKLQVESHIRTPENADAVIGAGQADMVSIVRGQIADPHMAAKAMDGRPEDVRHEERLIALRATGVVAPHRLRDGENRPAVGVRTSMLEALHGPPPVVLTVTTQMLSVRLPTRLSNGMRER